MMSGRSTRTAAQAEAAVGFAEALGRACADALGETVAGVILHGSLTLDDYVPGRSDVDLLVVGDDPPDEASFAALAEAVAGHRRWAPGRVDLRVVTRPVAASPAPAPPLEAYLELTPGPQPGPGLQVERHHPGERDLVVELSMCRAHGRSLLGAAPAELIGQVPDEWMVAAGDTQLTDWQAVGDDPTHAGLTVLTACRAWRLPRRAATAPRPRPVNGRSGGIPRSRWSAMRLGSAATRSCRSTPPRSAGSWQKFEPGWLRRAMAPN
jgi:hypothetical protein